MFQKLVRRLCEKLASKLEGHVIESPEGEVYLERYFVFRKSWVPKLLHDFVPSVFLHHFCLSDLDRDLHNHPWGKSVSLILAGGYTEERREIDEEGMGVTISTRVFNPGRLNVIRSDDFHRVTLHDPVNGCWSLFFAGQRAQDWGFWIRETDEVVPWKKYLRKNREDAKSFSEQVIDKIRQDGLRELS